MDWQLIQVLQIFVDTVMLVKDTAMKYEEMSQFANRLHLVKKLFTNIQFNDVYYFICTLHNAYYAFVHYVFIFS